MSGALVAGAKQLEAAFNVAKLQALSLLHDAATAPAAGSLAAENAELKRKVKSLEGGGGANKKKTDKVKYEYEGGGKAGKFAAVTFGGVRYEAKGGGNAANPKACNRQSCEKAHKCVFSHANK